MFGLFACLMAYFAEMPVYTFAFIFACTRIISTVLGWGLASRYLKEVKASLIHLLFCCSDVIPQNGV